MASLTISLEIPDGNVAAAQEGFLARRPNNMEGQYTDGEWMKFCIQRFVNKTCRQGWDIIRDRDAITIEDVFE